MITCMTKYALISVFDKEGLLPLAAAIRDSEYVIITTAGTGEYLDEHNIANTDISTVSKNPDALRDCLQAFSFYIAGGIVFDRHNSRHVSEVEWASVPQIDIVVMSITDIAQTVKNPSDFTIQNVDLGGPSMLRAAAINYKDVLVVPGARYYQEVASAIRANDVDLAFRKKMAIHTFTETASYDNELVDYLSS